MEKVRLGDVCTIKGGYAFKSELFASEGIPIIRIGNITKDGIVIDNDICYDEKFWEENDDYRIKKNDILIAMSGATVGKSCVNNTERKMLLNQRVASVSCDNKANLKYVFYNIYSENFTKYIMINSIGCAQPNISLKQIADFEILDIPIKEQKQIASVLDKVTDLIDKRKKQLEKLDELVKSRFVEMFGDPVINEKGWATKPLLEMGYCKNGMNFHYEDSGVEINCLGVGDFKDYSIISDTSILPTVSLNEMPSADYMLQDDDIVFVRSNGNKALVGRSVAVYPGKVPTTFSGFCIRYRKTDEAVNIPYLLRVLKAESVRQKMAGRGANIQNLNQQILGTLIIPVPPIELQNQFAAFVEQTDKSKLEMQKGLEKLEMLKKALMQKYFG